MAKRVLRRDFPKRRKDKPAGVAEKVINIVKILNLIESGSCPGVKDLARACEVSERSVYRYLYILNQVIPVVYDSKEGGYRFENPEALKTVVLSREEFALLVALNDFLKRLSSGLSETFMAIMDKFNIIGKCRDEVYFFLPLFEAVPDKGWFGTITKAILENKQLKIKYHSINRKELTERLIDPYGLVFYDNLWFVYAFCHLRNDMRTFALDRIISIEEMGTRFEKLEGFSLRERLKENWGLWEGEKIKVRVKFSSAIAEIIKRRPKWHPSEERTENPDGTVELTVTVSGKEEVKWWLYSWIPHIEIIEPESLKEEMKRELKEAIKRI